MSDWIKLHRRIRKHWLWENSDFLLAWIDMLMMANWKDRKKLFKMELHEIKRGEFPASIRKLSIRWNWSTGKTQRFLNLLKSDTMIDTQTDTGYTLIKIVNYEQYQVADRHTDKHTDKHTDDTLTDTTIRSNKKLKDNIYMQNSKKEQLKIIDIDALSIEFSGIDVPAEFEKWQDWMLSKGKTYKNYNAAFKNWLRSDFVKTKEGNGIKKVKLICPEHNNITVHTERGTVKYCVKCRRLMKSESELALIKIQDNA